MALADGDSDGDGGIDNCTVAILNETHLALMCRLPKAGLWIVDSVSGLFRGQSRDSVPASRYATKGSLEMATVMRMQRLHCNQWSIIGGLQCQGAHTCLLEVMLLMVRG